MSIIGQSAVASCDTNGYRDIIGDVNTKVDKACQEARCCCQTEI